MLALLRSCRASPWVKKSTPFVAVFQDLDIGVGVCSHLSPERLAAGSQTYRRTASGSEKNRQGARDGGWSWDPVQHSIWFTQSLMYMAGCQNYGPLLGPLNTRCRIILRTPKRNHNFDSQPYAECIRTAGHVDLYTSKLKSHTLS